MPPASGCNYKIEPFEPEACGTGSPPSTLTPQTMTGQRLPHILFPSPPDWHACSRPRLCTCCPLHAVQANTMGAMWQHAKGYGK